MRLFLRNVLYLKKNVTAKKKLMQHHKIELVILIDANADVSVN